MVEVIKGAKQNNMLGLANVDPYLVWRLLKLKWLSEGAKQAKGSVDRPVKIS